VVAAAEQPLARAAEVLVAVVLAGLHHADQTKPAGLVDSRRLKTCSNAMAGRRYGEVGFEPK